MKLGFVGTGSMGSILIEALVQSGTVPARDILASNRTRSKVEQLAERHPGLRVARSNVEVALDSEIIFLCVKPHEFVKVIEEIREVVLPSQIVVSITSPVLVKHLEEQLSCKIAKIVPSITNYACSGATLCIYGDRITQADQERLERLLSSISTPLQIDEQYTRVTSDISSCGPAFLCFFLQKFMDAAHEETGIPREQLSRLVGEMLLGTGRLLTEGGFTPESLQQRVNVPGGITGEGLRLLDEELQGVFNKLIRKTHAKYNKDLTKVETLFAESTLNRVE